MHQRFLIGFRQHLGRDATGFERCGQPVGMDAHVRDQHSAFGALLVAQRAQVPSRFMTDATRGFDAVEEGLTAGDHARIGRVLVHFDDQTGFAAQPVLEEVGDEGVRPTAEVGDIHRIEAVVFGDDFGG